MAKQLDVSESYFEKKTLKPFTSAEYDLYISSTFISSIIIFFLPSICVSHVAQHICALSRACRCDPQQTELYSEMLLTDRFHSSHRLEWLCLFLGCGLGQRLVLNSRCFSAGGCNQSARCRGRQERAM